MFSVLLLEKRYLLIRQKHQTAVKMMHRLLFVFLKLVLIAKLDRQKIEPGPGFAKNDGFEVGAWRSVLARVDKNDEITKSDGAKIVAIDGEAVNPGDT